MYYVQTWYLSDLCYFWQVLKGDNKVVNIDFELDFNHISQDS